ncbi:hypothetical protein HQ545_05825 [Candidatus Woesearchaeota archaeon]|nr:hypothetical protein [Candidatus Woesearchaeota archaeon]
MHKTYLDNIKTKFFWLTYFLFLIMFVLFSLADRLGLVVRVILVVLLAFLCVMFRFETYTFTIVVAILAGILTGAAFAGSAAQFWLLSFLYVLIFFIISKFIDKGLFEV